MELSSSLVSLLRDEAYTTLCQEALQEKLASLEKEKAAIENTRPPFGVLARRETRNAFTQSMRTAEGNDLALRERLVQVERLNAWLQPVIENEIAGYLVAASPDYRRFAQLDELLVTWLAGFNALPELVVAFARDLHAVRDAAAASNARGAFQIQSLAVLRDIALRLEQQHEHLLGLALQVQALTQGDADVARDVRVPALPEFRRVAWVSELALLPIAQCIATASRVETEMRAFVAAGSAAIEARIEASRSACQLHERRYLLHYWNQLRTHAQIHYVEEREIDDVIAELAQRYVQADIVRRQRALTRDPFRSER